MSRVYPPLQHYIRVETFQGKAALHIELDDDAAKRYTAFPSDVISDRLGVTIEDYWAFVEHQGRFQCVATTAHGHRCRNHLAGIQFDHPHDWATNRQDGYCVAHGGPENTASQDASRPAPSGHE